MTLPAFSAERRRACSKAPAAIDRFLLTAWALSSEPQPAAVATADDHGAGRQTDRQTDGHPTVE